MDQNPPTTPSQANDGSPVLRTVARIAAPLTAVMSIDVFFQGHNLPGGGFIAGVLIAAAGAIYLLGFGLEKAARISWWKISVIGLAISVATGAASYLNGGAFMDHTIWHFGKFHLPTATFFDVGVYLIVFGTLMTIFVELGQEKGV